MCLFPIYVRELSLQKSFHELLRGAIGSAGVLAFKTVLKIRCRLFSKYLVMEDAAGGIIEGLGLEVESKVEGFSNSSISLSIGKKTRDIGATEGTAEVQFLQKHL